jgi:hypothetical protein
MWWRLFSRNGKYSSTYVLLMPYEMLHSSSFGISKPTERRENEVLKKKTIE